jgi:hypothetical protein
MVVSPIVVVGDGDGGNGVVTGTDVVIEGVVLEQLFPKSISLSEPSLSLKVDVPPP